MIQGDRESVEWYVIFRSSTLNHWAMRWLDPCFQHCYAMKKSEGGQFWVVVDPTSSHTDVTLELVDDYPHPRLYAGPDSIIIPVKAHINPKQINHGLCVFTCVEVVKSLLGINEWKIMTPFQLYRRLINGRR